jgi:hypothetical protein
MLSLTLLRIFWVIVAIIHYMDAFRCDGTNQFMARKIRILEILLHLELFWRKYSNEHWKNKKNPRIIFLIAWCDENNCWKLAMYTWNSFKNELLVICWSIHRELQSYLFFKDIDFLTVLTSDLQMKKLILKVKYYFWWGRIPRIQQKNFDLLFKSGFSGKNRILVSR